MNHFILFFTEKGIEFSLDKKNVCFQLGRRICTCGFMR